MRPPTSLALLAAVSSSACSLVTSFGDYAFERDASIDASSSPRDAGTDAVGADAAPDAGDRDGGDVDSGRVVRPCDSSCSAPDECWLAECDRIAQIAAGARHTCARFASGRVSCWGSGTAGGLGDGRTTDRGGPSTIVGLPAESLQVAAGNQSGCALLADHTVACWGNNQFGQVGDGTVIERLTPVVVPVLSDVIEIASRQNHVCALRRDETVWCWGDNRSEQLGSTGTQSSSVPLQVHGVAGAQHVVTGSNHSCALLSDGAAWCWGANDALQLGSGIDRFGAPRPVPDVHGALEIVAGTSHTCVRLAGGTVTCWGSNGGGQLGADAAGMTSTPVGVHGVMDAVELAAGFDFTCARLVDGRVECWGGNNVGQLGANLALDTRLYPEPQRVDHLDDAEQITAGYRHSCVLRASGDGACWGEDYAGQLGRGESRQATVPTVVAGLRGVAALAVGHEHACAQPMDRRTRCWGSNEQGQLADSTRTTRSSPAPVDPNLEATQIVAGGQHTCAMDIMRRVVCWGSNGLGQLGVDPATIPFATTASALPMQPTQTGQRLSAGTTHTCEVYEGGGVYCWGANGYGQLADPMIVPSRFTPMLVPDLISSGSIAAGGLHSCASRGNAVACWGHGQLGELGNGLSTDSAAVVTVVLGDPGVKQVVAGDGFTCVLMQDATALCWGANWAGQLGIGSVGGSHPVPEPVLGLMEASALAAGRDFVCALGSTGSVACWGANQNGQLGDGTLEARATPTDVPGLVGVQLLAAGRDSTCAATADELSCWGARTFGKLGDGIDLLSAVPVPVARVP